MYLDIYKKKKSKIKKKTDEDWPVRLEHSTILSPLCEKTIYLYSRNRKLHFKMYSNLS